MNELTTEKTMTTKELAETLGVSIDTVTRTANKVIDPSAVLRRVINGGNSKVFTEEQATLIKQEIQGHHNLASRQIDNVNTDAEILNNAMVALADLKRLYDRKVAEYKATIETQQMKIAEQAPKVDFYDRVTESADCIDIGQCAKILNIKNIGRNKLFEILRQKKILNEHNQPYQKYVDCGYFRIIETSFNLPDGTQKINLKTVVFQKGLDFIRKMIEGAK